MDTNSKQHIPSLLLFIFGVVAAVILFGAAGFMLITDLISATFTDWLTPLSLVIYGILLIPAIIYSWQRWQGKEIPITSLRSMRWWLVLILVVTWIILVILANWLGGLPGFASVSALPFILAGVGIPLLLLLRIATGGIPLGSRQRAWGVFGSSLTLGTLASMIVEVVLILALIILVTAIIVGTQPGLIEELRYLATRLREGMDMDNLMDLVAPYLMKPLVLIGVLSVMAFFVPLIEELFKPIGVWLIGHRVDTPREGFALGAISGAGFALVEALNASNSTESVGPLLAMRAFASMMHILATGIMGYGIVSFRKQKNIMPLLGGYALAVFIHGAWNGSAVLTIYGALRVYISGMTNLDLIGGLITMIGLGGLLLLMGGGLIALLIINLKMRTNMAGEKDGVVPDAGIIAQPLTSDGKHATDKADH
jgi:RsiW-degrading membrane proteinase PrsW (M82 family)